MVAAAGKFWILNNVSFQILKKDTPTTDILSRDTDREKE